MKTQTHESVVARLRMDYPRTPVRVRANVLRERRDLQHYDEQTGYVSYVTGNVPEHVMVFWPGLSCSSLWAVRELEIAKLPIAKPPRHVKRVRTVTELRAILNDWRNAPSGQLDETLPRAAAMLTAMQERLDVLERLHPQWAQGHSSDSVAAQASTAALSQLWEMLGVTNQTDAVAALAAIIGKEKP